VFYDFNATKVLYKAMLIIEKLTEMMISGIETRNGATELLQISKIPFF